MKQDHKTKCVFRYYNASGSGRLSFSEFSDMVRDIRVIKGCSDDEEDVKSEAAISAKCVELKY